MLYWDKVVHVHSATTYSEWSETARGYLSVLSDTSIDKQQHFLLCVGTARSGSSTVSSCILLLQCLGPGMAVCVLYIKLMFPPICGLTDMQQEVLQKC